jgi:hypothetical protein
MRDLSTGKKRYAHPALTGLLPQPWLPLKRGETLVNSHNSNRTGRKFDQAVVLSLRKRYSVVRRGGRTSTTGISVPSRGVQIQDSVRCSLISLGENAQRHDQQALAGVDGWPIKSRAAESHHQSPVELRLRFRRYSTTGRRTLARGWGQRFRRR